MDLKLIRVGRRLINPSSIDYVEEKPDGRATKFDVYIRRRMDAVHVKGAEAVAFAKFLETCEVVVAAPAADPATEDPTP